MFVDFRKCFTEPKHLLRLVAVVMCICVACYQLSECIRKIIYPPKSTHYSFALNQTLNYPAVTLCRNPGFKTALFSKYGIEDEELHSSAWKTFNFTQFTLEEFFQDVTFKFHEFIVLHGFDGYPSNASVTSFFTFNYGRCFKVTADHESKAWTSDSGYFFYMKHTQKAMRPNWYVNLKHWNTSLKLAKASSSGFHVFIHDRSEMVTESLNQEDSFVEYIYLQPGEELEINLRPQEFSKLSSNKDECIADFGYSRSQCKERCIYKTITEAAGCQVPWMKNSALPFCSDYESILYITKKYNAFNTDSDFTSSKCNCLRACKLNLYSPFVRYRKDKGSTGSTLNVYFSSNLVSKMDEIIAYDWNLFLADLGGSLGFLLGLSVLSAFGAIEQLFVAIIKKKSANEVESLEKEDSNTMNEFEKYLGNLKLDVIDDRKDKKEEA